MDEAAKILARGSCEVLHCPVLEAVIRLMYLRLKRHSFVSSVLSHITSPTNDAEGRFHFYRMEPVKKLP